MIKIILYIILLLLLVAEGVRYLFSKDRLDRLEHLGMAVLLAVCAVGIGG